ncbi:MAG: rRNA pseudouridine synthase [Bacteroidetes bacterium]|nr:rRNA pseudouridine synthase [Bacteroidota bacterium]
MAQGRNNRKGNPSKRDDSSRGGNARKQTAGPKKTTSNSATKKEGIRLNKYIANSGVCSRREADMYIATGQVVVNGKVINEMGYRVMRTDEVKFDGRRISPEPPTFVVLNKPKGVATTNSESKGLTVMDIVAGASSAQIKPFGRLGRNATGLLLFTNDDAFRQKFSKKGIDRLFHVELNKNLKPEDLKKIQEGLKLEGKDVKVEEVSYVNKAPKKEVGLRIKHTGNSIIRSIFEHLGYDVVKVDCVTLGPVTKKDLPRGRYRHLSEEELTMFSRL